MCALLAARERATNYASNQWGCDGRLVAYASSQAHSLTVQFTDTSTAAGVADEW